MTRLDLIWRNVRYHARAHAALAAGVAVTAATLTGALLVGDSVRGSLRERATQRLAGADHVLAAEHRFFRASLERELARSAGGKVASLLSASATASLPDGSARANQVRVFGVDTSFADIARWTNHQVDPTSIWLSPSLARFLGVHPGDTIILRMQSADAAPAEVAINRRDDRSAGLRLSFAGVIEDQAGGALDLRSSGQPPRNAFVNRETLATALGQPGRANLMLAADAPPTGGRSAQYWQDQLKGFFQLPDAGLKVVALTNGGCELRSDRIFLEPAVEAAALTISNARPVLTYLANLISSGTNEVPYSMVGAAGPPYTPPDLLPDEVILTDWTARELRVAAGATVTLSWYDPDSGAALIERTNVFRVREVVPLTGAYADPSLMPDFPGITEAEHTRDWQGGFPLVYSIQPRDEAYWEQHRGTPKVWINPATGRRIWGNRYGTLTAIRFPGDPATVAAALRERLAPEQVGLRFEAAREAALRSASGGQDFGQLFLGFSFFLLGAALLLVVLLFRLALEQRMTELGTLTALGFTPAELRRLLVLESAIPIGVGILLGLPGGVVYAQGLLWGLGHLWSAAVGGSTLGFHSGTGSFAIAATATMAACLMAIYFVLRRFARRSARDLLGGLEPLSITPARSWDRPTAWLAATAAISLLGWGMASANGRSPGIFFGAGSLLLISLLLFVRSQLRRAHLPEAPRMTMPNLAWTSLTRRRSRTVAAISLLATGSFLVVAVSAFHRSETQPGKKSSGTGGFSLIAESALPVFEDLSQSNRLAQFLSEPFHGSIVPLRTRAGDDASCLNLDRAQRPRLLAVRPAALAGRFTFQAAAPGLDRSVGWGLLTNQLAADVIPAIGDAESIQWALGKKVGDLLDYEDEAGRRFQIRLVASVSSSILQGSLVVDEAAFRSRFPSAGGWRMFLIDTSPTERAADRDNLSSAFADFGWEIEPAADRLAAFHGVQNTYLGAFGVLGGLGLLLGTAGLAIILIRNVLERRAELAWLLAAGFRPSDVRHLVFLEHAFILGIGLVIGTATAALAVIPAFLTPGNSVPWLILALVLSTVAASGAVWTLLAARWCLRGPLLEELRAE